MEGPHRALDPQEGSVGWSGVWEEHVLPAEGGSNASDCGHCSLLSHPRPH